MDMYYTKIVVYTRIYNDLYLLNSLERVKDIKDIKGVKDVESVKDVENVKDVEGIESVKDIEGIKGIEDIGNFILNKSNLSKIKNIISLIRTPLNEHVHNEYDYMDVQLNLIYIAYLFKEIDYDIDVYEQSLNHKFISKCIDLLEDLIDDSLENLDDSDVLDDSSNELIMTSLYIIGGYVGINIKDEVNSARSFIKMMLLYDSDISTCNVSSNNVKVNNLRFYENDKEEEDNISSMTNKCMLKESNSFIEDDFWKLNINSLPH